MIRSNEPAVIAFTPKRKPRAARLNRARKLGDFCSIVSCAQKIAAETEDRRCGPKRRQHQVRLGPRKLVVSVCPTIVQVNDNPGDPLHGAQKER